LLNREARRGQRRPTQFTSDHRVPLSDSLDTVHKANELV